MGIHWWTLLVAIPLSCSVNIYLTHKHTKGHIMLKLLTLLIAGAAAAPQYGYPYGCPIGYQPAYGYYPQYRFATPDNLALQSRGIFDAWLPFSPFSIQSVKASFKTSGTNQKIQGEATFEQNLFAGKKYHIYVSTDCTTASGTLMTTVTAPNFMINGFYAKGTTTKWNLNGADGKTKLAKNTYYVVVIQDDSTTVYGCTAALA